MSHVLIRIAHGLIALLACVSPAWSASLITDLGTPPTTTAGNFVGGFGEGAFPHKLDESVAVDISSVFPGGLRFGGQLHTIMYINGHGNVTFVSEAGGGMVPQQIQANATFPRIAPYFSDTDTGPQQSFVSPGGTSQGSNRIYWDLDTVNKIVTVTWDDVGYFSNKVNRVNAYQLRLRNNGDNLFDIEFRYEYLGWICGDGSNSFQNGNEDGMPNADGSSVLARAGYTAANGVNFLGLMQDRRQRDGV
ncbi:MAG: hypothetical protein H0W72_15815 [Planctomycetes bacterium]|nr:hypothetical protein [Planctomycetota bacterium]